MNTDALTGLLRSLASGEGERGGRVRAQGLHGSSRAWLLSRVVDTLARPVLVLTASRVEARAFTDELRFFLGEGDDPHPWSSRVVHLPPWDTLAFEGLTPHPEISAQRTAALFRARHGGPFIMVAPVEAALQRLVPPDALEEAALTLSVGEQTGRDELVAHLVLAGYHRVSQVEERGEVSVRGGIVDIHAPFYPQPVRIEFFGDEVESIRTFDPATQRSVDKLTDAVLLPAREVTGDEAAAEQALAGLRRRCHQLGMTRSQTADAMAPFRTDPLGAHRDLFAAYFHEKTATLWDYLDADAVLTLDMAREVDERVGEFDEETRGGIDRAEAAPRLCPRREEAYLSAEQWRATLNEAGRTVLELESLAVETAEAQPGPAIRDFTTHGNEDLVAALKRNRGHERLLTPLVETIAKARSDGHWVGLVARSKGSAERLRTFLAEYDLPLGEAAPFAAATAMATDQAGEVSLCLGELERGFRFPADRITLITETEIFGRKGRSPAVRRGGFSTSLAELTEGDLVVHTDFGVGRYQGMVRLEVQEEVGDYLHLEYAGGDRLYLPVTRLGLVQRYTAPGGAETVRLDKLGGTAWEKARTKAREGIEKLAHELLDLYARREMARRPAYGAPGLAYREFEATFPYEETRDQAGAIDAVMDDMGSDKPMDRLICGDVGYGKTEVAIRAAFRAADEGRQVALLAPTTVLAAQHYQNIKKRFEGYPLEVAMLSRFVSKADQDDAVDRIKSGAVDVVVGTHRLIQSDVGYKNLGLVVVDEEHRFGVRQKEKMKKLRNQVDVLSLSATPIPRTLQMGFTNVRDLSVIETPPADRQAVRTRLARFDDEVIVEAIRRELNRGGQVYFVHNRVQSIGEVAAHLAELFPDMRLGVGHGQMKEDKLQQVMEDFAGGEIDVLVCTAIIESGLDIPRANTILINRADMFGLADLYQLRGRVGRSNLRAYCYLLVPEERELTPDARKRLQTIQQFTDLGAGFKVAIHDLEIRGAGDLLGKNQSGHIAAIGFDLYAELLEEAVHRLKGQPLTRAPEPEIRLRLPAHFPEAYVEEPRLRLTLYERLSRLETAHDLDEVRYELIDRFGPVPLPVEHLLEVMKLRLRLIGLRAEGLDYTGAELVVRFGDSPAVTLEAVLALVQAEPARCRVTPDHRIRWRTEELGDSQLFEAAHDLLRRLEGCASV